MTLESGGLVACKTAFNLKSHSPQAKYGPPSAMTKALHVWDLWLVVKAFVTTKVWRSHVVLLSYVPDSTSFLISYGKQPYGRMKPFFMSVSHVELIRTEYPLRGKHDFSQSVERD